jgi:hypothetical protein
MADLKISQLTAATTPLGGTEVLPIVQSGSTVKATIANVQAAPIAALSADSVLFTNATKVPSTGIKLTYDGTLLNTGSAGATGTHFRVLANGAMAQFNTGAAADGRIEYAYNSVNMAYIGINNSTDFVIWGRAGSSVRIGANNAVRAEFQSGGDIVFNVGNLIQGTAAKGVNFTANTPAAGMTSQLLNWYEEGTWTPTYSPASGAFTSVTYNTNTYGRYTRVGRLVTIQGIIITDELTLGTAVGNLRIAGLPFSAAKDAAVYAGYVAGFNTNNPSAGYVSGSVIFLTYRTTANGATSNSMAGDLTTGASAFQNYLTFSTSYIV